jgi:hypothetical protein
LGRSLPHLSFAVEGQKRKAENLRASLIILGVVALCVAEPTRITLRPGEQWSVAIHPMGVEMKGRIVIGSRGEAELQARALINDWLKQHSTQNPKLN